MRRCLVAPIKAYTIIEVASTAINANPSRERNPESTPSVGLVAKRELAVTVKLVHEMFGVGDSHAEQTCVLPALSQKCNQYVARVRYLEYTAV